MNNPFEVIDARLSNIEQLLLGIKHYPGNTEDTSTSQEFYTLKQAAKFLNISEQTIYQNIQKIPHSKRFGKLYFLRSELEVYLTEGKVRSKNN
jgi:predicted DNA-binding transcriptional regulator AlpA